MADAATTPVAPRCLLLGGGHCAGISGYVRRVLDAAAGRAGVVAPVGADAYTRRLSTADEASTLRWIRAETRRRFSAEEASMSIFPPEQVRVHWIMYM